MIDTIYSVRKICDLFGFKDPRTARKIMREMEHTENPLLVTESAVRRWMEKKTLPPENEIRQLLRGCG